uniref:C10orf11 homolog n=1 Tax=Caligus clemensi TaxID=344056 RepID=C1C366_CALCM|nr:C10orf11 homolog [Caligus clemensi]
MNSRKSYQHFEHDNLSTTLSGSKNNWNHSLFDNSFNYNNQYILDLSHTFLEDLSGLVDFPFLKALILNNCSLTNKAISTLPELHHLETLSLNKNELYDISLTCEHIKSSCPNLRHLSLHLNPICPDELSETFNLSYDYERYRNYCIRKIPTLAFLDSSPVTLKEKMYANNIIN